MSWWTEKSRDYRLVVDVFLWEFVSFWWPSESSWDYELISSGFLARTFQELARTSRYRISWFIIGVIPCSSKNYRCSLISDNGNNGESEPRRSKQLLTALLCICRCHYSGSTIIVPLSWLILEIFRRTSPVLTDAWKLSARELQEPSLHPYRRLLRTRSIQRRISNACVFEEHWTSLESSQLLNYLFEFAFILSTPFHRSTQMSFLLYFAVPWLALWFPTWSIST